MAVEAGEHGDGCGGGGARFSVQATLMILSQGEAEKVVGVAASWEMFL